MANLKERGMETWAEMAGKWNDAEMLKTLIS